MTEAIHKEPSTLTVQVASEIRSLMARRGLSSMQLGRLLGYSQPWVSERLRGSRSITIADLEQIADALGVRVLDLFPRTEARSTEEVIATIGLNRLRRAAPVRRLRRVTEESVRRTRPLDRRPAGTPGGIPTPRSTTRAAA